MPQAGLDRLPGAMLTRAAPRPPSPPDNNGSGGHASATSRTQRPTRTCQTLPKRAALAPAQNEATGKGSPDTLLQKVTDRYNFPLSASVPLWHIPQPAAQQGATPRNTAQQIAPPAQNEPTRTKTRERPHAGTRTSRFPHTPSDTPLFPRQPPGYIPPRHPRPP